MTNLDKPQTKLELLALFGKSRDEELNLAEAELLNKLLISDSRIRGLYRGFAAIESGLEEIAQLQSGKKNATDANMSVIHDTISDIPVTDQPQTSDSASNRRKK